MGTTAHRFAIERTLLESFVGQLDDDAKFVKLIAPIEGMLAGRIPGIYTLTVVSASPQPPEFVTVRRIVGFLTRCWRPLRRVPLARPSGLRFRTWSFPFTSTVGAGTAPDSLCPTVCLGCRTQQIGAGRTSARR